MYKLFSIVFLFLTIGAIGQDLKKYDSTLKIGKVGFRVSCTNKSLNQNTLSIKPIGFKSEAREINLELKARIISSEIDDLNQDNLPDLIIFILEASGKKNLFCVSSKSDDGKDQPMYMQPIYFPDIMNDVQLSKGYRGGDEYKLVEGILFRKFPIYDTDTMIKAPTQKMRQIMYRVMNGDKGILNFKAFKNFELNAY
jgi:hypothetical protein